MWEKKSEVWVKELCFSAHGVARSELHQITDLTVGGVIIIREWRVG